LFSKAKREMWGVVLGILLGIVLTLLIINLLRTRVQQQTIFEEIPVDAPYYFVPLAWGAYGGYGSGGYSGGIGHHGGGGHGGGGHGGGGHGGGHGH
jgi:uncharacterized membrane protein YgcG